LEEFVEMIIQMLYPSV